MRRYLHLLGADKLIVNTFIEKFLQENLQQCTGKWDHEIDESGQFSGKNMIPPFFSFVEFFVLQKDEWLYEVNYFDLLPSDCFECWV